MEEVSKRMYRPWLGLELVRIITGYEKMITDFRDFSSGAIIQVLTDYWRSLSTLPFICTAFIVS